MYPREVQSLVLILPLALFYLAFFLKSATSYIEKSFSKERPFAGLILPGGKELSLMSMALDMAILLKNIGQFKAMESFSAIPLATIVPILLFVIHLLFYTLSTFVEIKHRDGPTLSTKMVGMMIGLLAIFSNSWSIELLIVR